MKHAQNPRRGRGRGPGPGGRHQPSKNRNFESSGGETKVRGNAQQVLDKYQAMARDAASAGEHILAEGYWQHAEHYFRILNADRAERAEKAERTERPENRNNENPRSDNGGQEISAKAETRQQGERTGVRDIPIETTTVSPASARRKAPAKKNFTEQAKPIEQAPPVEQILPTEQPQPAAPVQPAASAKPDVKDEVEKPKRRGRPRKAVAKADESADAASTPPSPETASA